MEGAKSLSWELGNYSGVFSAQSVSELFPLWLFSFQNFIIRVMNNLRRPGWLRKIVLKNNTNSYRFTGHLL